MPFVYRTSVSINALGLFKSRSVFSPKPPVKCRHLTHAYTTCGPLSIGIRHPRDRTRRGGLQVTSRPWTFRAAAIGATLAAASATFATFAVAEANTPANPAAVNRHDPQPVKQKEHDFDGPLSKTQDAQRQEALDQVISGKAKIKNRDGSNVVQLKGKKGDSKYVELGREEDRQDLHDPGRVRRPGRQPLRRHPGPAAQQDRQAGPQEGQQHGLAGGLQPEALPGPVLRHRQGHRVAEEVLRDAVLGPLLGRR